ncbi:caffeoylshikimate esterase-like [Magnolia sinica]|uniref:caffeoylshikimate esterase-like n=1 Tax=Magnolia sinica TaxID=86752 RepID=UPI0026598B39|nr:caffeoylshikimate esterase-like [Magnolia sinica]
MAHPIHEATEHSPFGDLTKEEFCRKHHVQNKESFMINKQGMKIFTQSWWPDSPAQLKGIVAMIHGYTDESSSIIQLTAMAIAKLGFYVCALDLPGHGYSDGTRGHIPDINVVVDDCIQLFDSVRMAHPNLPAFIYGESLGGAISIFVCLRQKREWNGLILNGAMCGVSQKFLPPWPLTELLPIVAFFLPTWRAVITRSLATRSYKEEWKRKLFARSPNRLSSSRPTTATALEFLRLCNEIERRCNELEIALLVLHGEDDTVCDPSSAKLVYEMARSKDKTLEIFPGMWHQLIGEPEDGVELAFGTIFSWLQDRADKGKSINGSIHGEI